jgi:uncharacterized protein YgiM (DUF1202 family)
MGDEGEFPYKLTVSGPSIEVRSGPGADFYVTGQLAAGEEVEVYRHEDGDWLAIRPPEGSFSWVRGDQLKKTDQPDVAKVIQESAVCCLGSKVADVRGFVCQVRLHEGELVQLLDSDAEDSGDARKDWRRIAPPAGEFRYVPSSAFQPRDPAEQAATELAATPADIASEGVPSPAGTESQAAESEVVRIISPSADPNANAAARPGSAPQDGQWVAKEESAAEAVRVAEPEPRAASASGQTTPPPALDESSAWVARGTTSDDDIRQMQMELTVMVAEDMSAWRLPPLQRRVEAAIKKAGTPKVQSDAEQLLARIHKFSELQNRATSSAGRPQDATGAVTIGAPPASLAAATETKYDGSGWLVTVHSTKGVAPPFALLDAQGDVRQYVTPAPGLNLHRYVRSHVGLFGQRGQMATLNKPHLTAERVVDLKRHLR